MNLVSDRRANIVLHAIIVVGLTAGMSAITYARYMDHRAEVTAREGVMLVKVLEMKSRAAQARRSGGCTAHPNARTARTDVHGTDEAETDAAHAEDSGDETSLDEAVFEAGMLVFPTETIIVRD